jgi:hypothetical protein
VIAIALDYSFTHKMHVCLSGLLPSAIEALPPLLLLLLLLKRAPEAGGNGIVEAGLKGEFMPKSNGLVIPGLCIGPGVPITPLPAAVGFRDRGAGRTRQIEVTFSYRFRAWKRTMSSQTGS